VRLWNAVRPSNPPALGLLAGLALLLASPAVAEDVAPPSVQPALATGEKSSRDAALVIGNEAYHSLPQSQWAATDARAFRDWLNASRGVSAYRTTYLENVDARAIYKQAKRMKWRVKRGGTAWVYYAGHATVLPDGRRAVMPIDATGASLDASGIPLDDLVVNVLSNRRVRRVVVVVDAGFGVAGRDGYELVPGRKAAKPRPLPSDDDRLVIWTASAETGPTPLYESAKQGLFTWTVLGGLRGWADGSVTGERDGKVTLQEAQRFSADAAVMLGRDLYPSIDTRSGMVGVPLVQGASLEAWPGLEVFEALADADTAKRLAVTEERVRGDAEAFWRDTMALVQEGGPGGREALEAYISEFDTVRIQVERRVYLPQVADARRLLGDYDESAPPPPPPAGEQAVAAVVTCDDLVALEGGALLGELGAGAYACLERALTAERMQTTRNKISRLLIIDAESRKDWDTWERLVQRHLEDIDRSDADLCLRYSVYLHKTGGIDLAEDAIHWAGYALENKQNWSGDDYKRKVGGLHRLRAEAAHRLWTDAEKAYSADPNGQTDRMAKEFRGLAKGYSREWLDYARAAGQKTAQAYQLCLTASGAEMFCAAE